VACALQYGDVVVATQANGSVHAVNSISGSESFVSLGGLLSNPSHIQIDSLGRIYTAERTGGPSSGIVRIDPSGNQQLISPIAFPVALAFDNSNNLVVANHDRQLFHIDLQTNVQTPIATLTDISSVQDVDVDKQGRIVVLDFGDIPSGTGGKIVRYDPATGQQSTVFSGGPNAFFADLVIDPNGNYLIADGGNLYSIAPDTGAESLALSGVTGTWFAFENANTIWFAQFDALAPLVRANLLTGETQTLSHDGYFGTPVGIAVYVPEPSSVSLITVGIVVLFSRRRRGTFR
jgi:sugar lactone lactonase YvrE